MLKNKQPISIFTVLLLEVLLSTISGVFSSEQNLNNMLQFPKTLNVFFTISFSRFKLSLALFFLLLFSVQNLNAQNLANENKIIDYLGMEKYTSILQSNPNYLKFLDARCSYGYHLMDYVEEKMVDLPVIEVIYHSEWKVVDINGKDCMEFIQKKITPEQFMIDYESDDFNFLEYKFTFDRKEVVYHVLGSTGKVIMIVPTEQINKIVNTEN